MFWKGPTRAGKRRILLRPSFRLAAIPAVTIPLVIVLFASSHGFGARDVFQPAAPKLGLVALNDGANLIVSWNWQAEPVRNADRAILTVADAGQSRQLEVDLLHDYGRKFAYTPRSRDVSFHLLLEDTKRHSVATESVRVLSPRAPAEERPIACYAVQTGAFRERARAESLKLDAEHQALPALLQFDDGAGLWRVLAGCEPSEERARVLARKLVPGTVPIIREATSPAPPVFRPLPPA